MRPSSHNAVIRIYRNRIAGQWLALAVGVAVASGLAISPAAAGQRTGKQVLSDIASTSKTMPNYYMDTKVGPRYRRQMAQEVGPALQRLAELDEELAEVDPYDAARRRADRATELAMLALYDQANALQTLNTMAASAAPADALTGKVGLLMYKWWDKPDESTQTDVLKDFAALASANPKEDILLSAALTMARYQAQSDGLAASLRDIAEHNLTGAAARRYQAQPQKLGRPLKISVGTIGGNDVSTASWKGKVVLIDFWATWCPPCRDAVPGLIQLYQADHARGLEVLGVSNDNSLAELKSFLASHSEMSWPESFNPTGADGWHALSTRLDVHEIPTTFLIDRNGILRDIRIGPAEKETVDKLLNEPVKPDSAEPVALPEASGVATAAATPDRSAGEQKADALLSLANTYMSNNLAARAKAKLQELLQKYPDSAAAPKAKSLLAQLDQQ